MTMLGEIPLDLVLFSSQKRGKTRGIGATSKKLIYTCMHLAGNMHV
jgi:hypothetical protein